MSRRIMLRYMSTDVEQPQWLTPKEVARDLRCDVASVYRAVKQRRLAGREVDPTTAHSESTESVLDQQKETTP